MPIQSYSLLKGTPTAGQVVSGSSAHYQITVQAMGGPFTVAVNIQSVDGSEVLYAMESNFTPPVPLTAVAAGIHTVPSKPGGLAIDFVRETVNGKPLIQRSQMALLPIASDTAKFIHEMQAEERRQQETEHAVSSRHASGSAHALGNAVVTLLNQAVSQKGSLVYAFGSAYQDNGVTDGIHDIHMNQGNPLNNHGADNGIWQDGALFVYLPKTKSYTAVFIAFQTESWNTDANGNPVTAAA